MPPPAPDVPPPSEHADDETRAARPPARAGGLTPDRETSSAAEGEDAAGNATFTTDAEGRFLTWSPGVGSVLGYAREEWGGRSAPVIFPPEDRASGAPEREMAQARACGRAGGVRWHVRKDGARFLADGAITPLYDRAGGPAGYAWVLRDLSEATPGEDVGRRRPADALRASERRFRALVDAASQIVWTNSPEGRMEGEQPGWTAFTGQTYGEYHGFGWAEAVHPEDRQPTLDAWGRCVRGRVPFVWEHRVRRHDGTYRAFTIRAVPVLADDGATILEWVGIHTDVTEQRARDAALRVALSREREARERERVRAEREALINRIGDCIRQSLPPGEIEALAMRSLGEALSADRCYLMAVDLSRDSIAIARDWHAEGVPTLAGEYRVSDLGVDFAALFAAGETLIVSDARPESERRLSDENATTNARIGVSSFVNVPFFDEGGRRVVGALGVAMAGGAREWTAAEVSLAETVAGQLRSAVEAVRQQEREHAIAQQLQEALLPELPETVPGLALRRYYRPALGEAGVGGDFIDAAVIGPDRTYLCVADLSGKGLAAAQQVALVKNMALFAVHTSPSLAEAITSVDRVLAGQNLLAGFATLFAGVYDARSRTLTYVNAGQEPGLIWRAATGAVERLSPTGAVLGGFESPGGYEQRAVALAPGDVFFAGTDGTTEVGPNRRELLGIDGLAALFARCCADGAAPGRADTSDSNAAAALVEKLVAGLVAGVEAHAGGAAGIRDDIALLVGVATPAGEPESAAGRALKAGRGWVPSFSGAPA